jgi:hypothetical protein
MDSKIRALCAQIALEYDTEKLDRLVGQLKRLFRGEDITVNLPSEEEPSILSMIEQKTS